jgi:hypothetical protein
VSSNRPARAHPYGCVALFALLASAPARADAPVSASVRVSADTQAVLRLLADHEQVLRVCPDVRSVRIVRTLPGGCAELAVETTGFLSPMHYRSRRCPQGAGYAEVLLESTDFSENSFTWSVVDEGAARRVTLSVRSVPMTAVPDWILERAVQRSVEQTVAAFAGRVDGSAGQTP